MDKDKKYESDVEADGDDERPEPERDESEDTPEARALRRIEEAKAKARPGTSYLLCYCYLALDVTLTLYWKTLVDYLFLELKTHESWFEHRYYETFDCSLTSFRESACVERIHVKDVSPDQFIEKYEKIYKPVVILGAQEDWNANLKWNPQVKSS